MDLTGGSFALHAEEKLRLNLFLIKKGIEMWIINLLGLKGSFLITLIVNKY